MPRARTKIRPTVQASLSSNPLECTHFFQLPQLGSEVLGVCKICGLEKMHYNSTSPDSLNPWRNKQSRDADNKKLVEELKNAEV
tara:strand:+ start:2084 stop:2335 length:252 start_codon:yes stop_codon:yes gene_type:complete